MGYVYTKFPDDFATNEEKSSLEFGQKVGEAIETQWFDGRLTVRRKWIRKMREYGKGEQTTDYQRMIEGDRKKKEKLKVKTHKIDYSVLKVMPTFKDILINAIDESLFKPRAEAIDITAVNKKQAFFRKLDEDFYTQDIAKIVSDGTGIDVNPTDVAKNEQQLRVRKLEYKPRIEIAQELAIENVFKHQRFESIKDKMDEDLVDLGIAVGRQYTDHAEGLRLRYVDPFNYIHSTFELDNGDDIRYHGELVYGTIGQLLKEAGRELESDELLAIKNYAIDDPNNTRPYDHSEDGERLIEYVSYAYLVTESRVFKKLRKNKSVKAVDRTKDGFNPSNKNKKIDIPYNIWYEGVYVPSAKVLLKWQKIPNQVEKEVNNPISPFVVYAPKVKRISERGHIRFDSLVQRAIPIIDDLHRTWFKFQQLKMELRPNTAVISPKALNNVFLSGQQVNPQDVLDLFFGRGILLADEVDEDGDPIGRAIREEGGGINNTALGFLSNEIVNSYQRLRQLVGINELRDGTTRPNSKTSVTVQKLLLASSNNATNHIVKASFQISLRFAEVVSLRLYDILTTKALKDRYMSIIGSNNVELLDAIKALPMHKFGIYFDFKPDNEERIAFEQSLITSLNAREINVAQYNKARQIRNVKSAVKYLEFTIDANAKRSEAERINNIQAQAEANAQTTLVSERSKQQTVTVEYETKKQLLLLEEEIRDRERRKKAITDDLLAERAHTRKMEVINAQTSGIIEKETLKEDRKDQRIDQQSSNQSELIEQRKNNTGVKNFSDASQSTSEFQTELDKIFDESRLLPNQDT